MPTSPEIVQLVIIALAAGSVARLLATDTIAEPPMSRLRERLAGRPMLLELSECPRCLSWWVTIVWLWVWLIWPDPAAVAAVPWAAWAVASFVGER